MRIAHVTWAMDIGGKQTLITGIANMQIKMGHEVGLFIMDNRIDETIMKKLDPQIKVFYFGRTKGTRSVKPFIKLNWQLWRFHPDIIHSHAGKLSKAIFTNVPMVVTFHNTRLDLNNFKKYQKGFAISEAVKDDIIKNGYNPHNVILIENGIPCDEIKCKTDFKISDIIHVVQVSRIFFHQKRQDLAVHALSLLKSRLNDELNYQDSKLNMRKCVMHFVGDGPDMSQLKEMVNQLGLENDVVFEGYKDRNWVFDHLCDFDLFLQPSDYEGFGLTVAEACAAKLPVLVSDIEGPLEIIDGGKLGMVFKHGNADDLADKLFQFIRDGYDLAIVEDAYQNTLKNYDIAKTTQRYIEEYEEVIGK